MIKKTKTLISPGEGVSVERQQAEHAMQEDALRFKAIFNSSGVGITMRSAYDRTLPWTQVNDRFCELLGYTREELLRLSPADITPPDEQVRAVSVGERLLSGEIQDYVREKRIIGKDGRSIWVNLTVAVLFDADGRPREHIAIFQDITARKQSEEAHANLAAIVENANDAIVSRSLDGLIQSWNKAAERMFGWSAQEAIGQPITILVPPERHGEVRPLIERVIHGETVGAIESLHCHRDGSLINTAVTFSPTRDAAGNVISLSIIYRNITNQKQVENALRESEQLFRAIFNHAGVGISMRPAHDRTHPWTRVNDQFCKLLGYTREELLKLSTVDITPPDEQARAVADNKRLLSGDVENFVREKRLIHKDGRSIWVLLSVASLPAADGQPHENIAFHQDITERKNADAAVARLAAIVGSSNDAIISRGLDRKVLSWNAAAERMLGYTAEEIIGQPVDCIIPCDQELQSAQMRKLLHAGQALMAYDAVRLTKDGRRIDVSVTQSPIKDANGTVTGVSITFRDIAARKQIEAELAHHRDDLHVLVEERTQALQDSEARLRAIFSSVVDGIVTIDAHGHVQSFNPAAEKLFGYSLDEVRGQNVKMLMSEPYASEHDSYLHNYRTTGRKKIIGIGREVAGKRKDGSIFPMDLAISEMEINGERFFTGVVRDITERRKSEAEIRYLNADLAHRLRDLEVANQELSAFSYTIAHDLRTPLRAINGYSALLEKSNAGKLDQDSVDNLSQVRAASNRMGELIDDLLKLAQLSRQEMRRQDFSLSELADNVVASLTKAHPERNVQITIQPDMNVIGDSGLMRVVLENLVGNAWKFTAKAGAARIEICGEQRDGKIVYCVRDNGVGFDMKYVNKLFVPFQRLHHPSEFEGTGIGLTMVKRIIQRHLGEVWIESAPNFGTTVFFWLGKPA